MALQTEFVTEILDRSRWPKALAVIGQFLTSKGIDEVRVEFGFVLERDLRGEPVPEDQIVPLPELDAFIERGLKEGTIEWGKASDFIFSPIGADLKFKLCNDADLHFSSADTELLAELGRTLTSSGIKVYG